MSKPEEAEELYNSFKKLEFQITKLNYEKEKVKQKLYDFMFPEILKHWFKLLEEELSITIPAEKLESLRDTLLSNLNSLPRTKNNQLKNHPEFSIDYFYKNESVVYDIFNYSERYLNYEHKESFKFETFEQFEAIEDKYKLAALFSKIFYKIPEINVVEEYLRIYKPEEYYYESSTPSRRSSASGWSSDY